MRDKDIPQHKEFLDSIDEFTPTHQDVCDICEGIGILWSVTAVVFFILRIGNAFPVKPLPSDLMKAVAATFFVGFYGVWLAKGAKTQEEWTQGIYLTAFPATFLLGIVLAGL